MTTNHDEVDLSPVEARFAPGWAPSVLYGQPGWHELIVELDRALVEIMPSIRYCQIKQKFGGLRVYTVKSNPEVDELIREAEQRAERTCEMCGWAGQLHRSQHGWFRTLCPSCASEHPHGYRPVQGR